MMQKPPISPEERFQKIDSVFETIGHRALARKTDLSASHVNRVLRGKIKDLTVKTATKIARAAQLSRDDVIFYVERQRD